PLALLVPLDHPVDARPRLLGGDSPGRPYPPPVTVRADPVALQRDPAPVRGPHRPPGRGPQPPAGLVAVATSTSGTRPHLPLPTTGRLATMKITIYPWGTRGHPPCQGRFSPTALQRLRTEGKTELHCTTCGAPHDVSRLLTGYPGRVTTGPASNAELSPRPDNFEQR